MKVSLKLKISLRNRKIRGYLTSQLAIYPPEKHVFWFFSTIYAILVIFSQWIWCAVVRRKMKRSLQSRILFVLVDLTALLMTISGMFILGLTYIDGYEEFKWCAISEWIMTFDAYAIHILQGLEIGEISKSLIHSMSKSTLNKNKRV
ncbi:unnamed protein product [Heterobilharzia americana]|nr:unnamed protein product [Heterobilharzia americana]